MFSRDRYSIVKFSGMAAGTRFFSTTDNIIVNISDNLLTQIITVHSNDSLLFNADIASIITADQNINVTDTLSIFITDNNHVSFPLVTNDNLILYSSVSSVLNTNFNAISNLLLNVDLSSILLSNISIIDNLNLDLIYTILLNVDLNVIENLLILQEVSEPAAQTSTWIQIIYLHATTEHQSIQLKSRF